MVEFTKNVVYFEDGEIAQLSLDAGLKNKESKIKKKLYVQELEMQLEALKGL